MDEKKIQEMQMLEQGMHNILLQKQAFQIELAETQSALNEIEKTDDEVYKIIGQLMIKKNKTQIKEELLNKEKLLNLRIKSLEKQEASVVTQLEKFREEALKFSKK
jgi:prefoldin beta subunit